MSTHFERIAVFQDTLAWISKDPDLAASIPVAKKHTTVFQCLCASGEWWNLYE